MKSAAALLLATCLSVGGAAWADGIQGTPGADDLVGTDGPDTITALGGDDVVHARAGMGIAHGGGTYGTAGMRVDCGPGDDVLIFNQPSPKVERVRCEVVKVKSAG